MPKARRAFTCLVNGIAVAVVAAGIILMLANSGIIARPATQVLTLGG